MPKASELLIGSGVLVAALTFLGNAVLQHFQSRSELELERERYETQLILRAIDPNDLAKTRETLRFYADADLVSNPDELRSRLDDEAFLPQSRGAIACYSHRDSGALYLLSGTAGEPDATYVMGFVEGLPGTYDADGIFRPRRYGRADISEIPYFAQLCSERLPSACPEADSCWAGGDTGGLYGYPRAGAG